MQRSITPGGRLLSHRWMFVLVTMLLFGAATSWAQTTPAREQPDQPNPPVDLMPLDQAVELLSEFHRGAALLEQYEYSDAAAVFKSVLEKSPQWVAARFNYGLASFNMQSAASLQQCERAYQKVLAEDPGNRSALYCLGLYYHHMGELEKALDYFALVRLADPNDPYVAFKYADVLLSLDHTQQGVEVLEQVIELDPGFISAFYRLGLEYRRLQKTEEAIQLLKRFSELQKAELTGRTFLVEKAYGSAGQYYTALDAQNHPIMKRFPRTEYPVIFSPDVQELEVTPRSWSWQDNRIGMPGIAVADVDSDGDLDLLLTATGEDATCSFWLNDGQGHFSAGQAIPQRATTACLGDVDNDGDDDLWLGGADGESLWLNDGQAHFQRQELAVPDADGAWTAIARQLDLDSDGDLDLLALRKTTGTLPAGGPSQGAANRVLNNNRDGTFADVSQQLGLQLSDSATVACVCDDLDSDRDLDLLLFDANASKSRLWVNDRMGVFRVQSLDQPGLACQQVISATTGDPDKDGDQDVLICTAQSLRLYRNVGQLRFELDDSFTRRYGALQATGAQFVDMDNDGDLDLLLSDANRPPSGRGPALLINTWPTPGWINAQEQNGGNLLSALETTGHTSMVAADFNGDGTCDILLAPMDSPVKLVKNVTAGGHWIELDLHGTHDAEKKSRGNFSGIGARVEIKTGNVYQQYLVGNVAGPVTLAPLRVHAGLGAHPKLDWLRVIWPDGVLQAEFELAGDQRHRVEELSRKSSSCPYLFAWDGTRFRFVADFGGVGGLGYLVAPGEFAPPDPTEYVPVPNLAPLGEHYVLNALTVLEEVTYFDEAKLIAIDHPQGTQVVPHEMMAISVPPPDFELFCYRQGILPRQARDHRGTDVTAQLAQVDRRYAGATQRDRRFAGLAAAHFVELDFGDQLGRLEPKDRLILLADGWVEYGYSATNYAASQAGLRTQAPSIFAWRDGAWVKLLHEVGYPAGTQHHMTVDLTGKVLPSDQRLRITSNMELYWDRIQLVIHDPQANLVTQEVAAASADLHYFGFPREYSPDGRHPLLSDYDNVDPSTTWKLMAGDYTRYGELAPLVGSADDRFVIMARGDELTLRFPVQALRPVPPGYQRSFLLKTDSYCKDMDLHTAFPDTVEPLPFHGMSGYPYGDDEHYPQDAAHQQYQQEYNTRRVRTR